MTVGIISENRTKRLPAAACARLASGLLLSRP